MSKVIPFQFESYDVRAVLGDDGEPWFVGKDVAEILGYTNPSKAINDHCKGVTKRYPLQTQGGVQEVRIINEPDMFRLVVNSTMPAAEKFERWVFEEVLPAIRKTGRYVSKKALVPPEVDAAKYLPILIRAARAIGLDKNVAAISANIAVRKITGVDTLALMDQTYLVAENQQHMYFTPTELGKRIGVSGRRFNQLLQEAGLQECHDGVWIPIESKAKGLYRILDTGKRYSDGTMVPQLKWSDAVLSYLPSQENVIPLPEPEAIM
jgi:prophage antirepressor-like protein